MSVSFDDLASPKTFLPGVKARYAIISPACRTTHGDTRAAEIAIATIHRELTELLERWGPERAATFHLVVTVDRQGRGDPGAA